MKTTSKLILSQLLSVKENEMLLVCTSVGNPDRGQYAPLSDPEYFAVSNYEQASAAAAAYIAMWDLGGGNWNNGNIYNKAGELIARVSYNGRVWSLTNSGEVAVDVDSSVVAQFRAYYDEKYAEILEAFINK